MEQTRKVTIRKNVAEKLEGDVNDTVLLLVGLVNWVYERNITAPYSVSFSSSDKNEATKVFATLTDEEASARDALKSIRKSHTMPEEYGLGNDDGLYGIDFEASPADNGDVNLTLGYDSEKISALKIDTITEMLSVFSEQLLGNPDINISCLEKVSREDAEKIIDSSKGIDLPVDREKTWLDLFKNNVFASPGALAVSADDGTYTYQELDHASDILALSLLGKGAEKGDFIGLKLDRTKNFVTAITAIHKAGCAYLPIDIAYPEERINFMIEDSGAKIILTAEEIEEAIQNGRSKYKEEDFDKIPGAEPKGKAYMIYTSGSTGKPKGVMIAHESLMNFTVSIKHLAGIQNNDRILAHRSFSFDAHIEDYFPTLASGASVFILGEEKRRDYDEIVEFMKENRLTGGGFTTSVARILMTEYELPLRYIIAGGEALYGITGKKSIQIINEYGPTECTDDSTWFPLQTGVSYNNVPIGRAMPNNWCFVLDKHEKLLPMGVAGELCVAGIQVGMGYHNRDELTKKVFTDCPFIKNTRMYHTGDLVRYNKDGLIEFLGRIDNQVKLNGYRIELGEIEAIAGKYEGIKETVALVSEVFGGRHLVLYYTEKNGAVVDESRLRNFMSASTLPDYMKPEMYSRLEKMPLLPNAKIDRKHMPAPKHPKEIINEQPETALETHILNAAKEILPGLEFGVTDDLFELGMTSLSTMMFVSKINSLRYGLSYRVADVMRYRTIRKLINGNKRVFWNYNEYEKEKPMLVFVYGVAPVARTLQMLKVFHREFNIFVIEPTDEHYDLLFKDTDYDELNDMYLTILENNLPKECSRIDGFMGFSWGGCIAYTLAAAWSKKHAEKPFVLMGDSDFADMLSDIPQKEYSLSDYPENLFELLGGTLTRLELVKKMNMVRTMNMTVKELPRYDGKVVQLNALKIQPDSKNPDEKQKNLEVIAQYASNLEVIDFKNHTHNDLFYDDAQVENYISIMKNQCQG